MSERERDLLDWLVLHAPGAAASIRARAVRLKTRTRLRKRVPNLSIRQGFAAMARGDVEVWMRSMGGVGISDCYRGHAGVHALYGWKQPLAAVGLSE